MLFGCLRLYMYTDLRVFRCSPHLVLCSVDPLHANRGGIEPCLRLWNIVLETQLKVSWVFFGGEYPSILKKKQRRHSHEMLFVADFEVEADMNREWCWCLMGQDLLLVADFMDGWCVGLYEEALFLHQKLLGDLLDYTFGSVLAYWQRCKNLHHESRPNLAHSKFMHVLP